MRWGLTLIAGLALLCGAASAAWAQGKPAYAGPKGMGAQKGQMTQAQTRARLRQCFADLKKAEAEATPDQAKIEQMRSEIQCLKRQMSGKGGGGQMGPGAGAGNCPLGGPGLGMGMGRGPGGGMGAGMGGPGMGRGAGGGRRRGPGR